MGMRFEVKVRVDIKDGTRLVGRMQPRTAANALKYAKHVAELAKGFTLRVDTGAMRDGYVVDELSGGHVMVYNKMFYQMFHEFGTKYISAMPMLVPALEQTRQPFVRSHKEIFE